MSEPQFTSDAKRARPASIEDVANAAGVSTATVSRLLNKPDLVAPETAARIYKAIEALGYRPNVFAKGLSTRRSQVVGILLPDIHGEFYSELLRGADAEAHRRGYHLLVSSESHLAPGATGLTNIFGLVDGLAVMLAEPNERLWRAARQTDLPIVALDADPHEKDVDTVLVDNAAGAAEATRHLLRSVLPERLYFVGGPRENFDTQQRARAFADTLRAAAPGHTLRDDQITFGDYSADWGRRWATALLARSRAATAAAHTSPPVGALAGNDEIAYGIMTAFQDAGRHVPEDLRIVGFDDTRLASLIRPALSTVRVPLVEIGAAAIGALIDRLDNPARAAAEIRLPATLIVRASSTAP